MATKPADWIEWNGGKAPAKRGARVDIRHRDGDEYLNVKIGDPVADSWTVDGDHPGDIVAYRLAEASA